MLGWATFAGLRVLTVKQNAIEVGAEALVNGPQEFAFQAYLKIPDYYLRLGPGHVLLD